MLGLGIAMHFVGPAGLDAAQDGDQVGGIGQGAHQVLLALLARRQVMDAARWRDLSEAFTGLLDPLAEIEHGVAEVFEQHDGGRQEGGQAVDIRQSPQRAHEAKAVEAAEGALNLVLMPRYKGLHGVVSGRGESWRTLHNLPGATPAFTPFGCGRQAAL
jgi:hypothetical protein